MICKPLLRIWLTACLLVASLGVGWAQDYTISPGDKIEFDILDDDEEVRTISVAQDGQVQLPLLGTLVVSGLTVPEAIEKIRTNYIERDLLKDPKISLAIAVFRPVFVLGDVARPGEVEFRPNMTVEQAVGLAGGPSTVTSNAEQQLLNEAVLRGELRVIAAELAQKSAEFARLSAQINGDDAINITAVPEEVRDLIELRQFEDYGSVESLILEQDRIQLVADKETVEDQLEAMELEISLLDERVAEQQTQIEGYESERDRLRQLSERGLSTRDRQAGAEQTYNNALSAMLESQRRQAEAVRKRSEIRNALADVEREARRQSLTQLQQTRLELQRLVERRKSAEERIFLVTSWQSQRSRDQLSINLSYSVRREVEGVLETSAVDFSDPVLPGDVVLVSIDLPG
ncbi:MAG: polysaccharide biosynthesis/export family protein [Pseudomonadota bacterium]